MSDIKEVLSSITRDQVIDMLIDLGSLPPIVNSNRPDELIFSSICCHEVKEKYKLYCYFNENQASFHCYICSQQYSNIVNLIMHIKKIEFSEAFRYVKDKCGIIGSFKAKIGFGDDTQIEDWSIFSRYKVYKRPKPMVNERLDDRVMGLFTDEYYYKWVEEGISVDSMEKFDIKYYLMNNAIVIPHFDISGELVGIRKRNLSQAEVEAGFKYMPLKVQNRLYNHPLQYHLYGLHRNKEVIKRLKKVVIVESEKGVLQCETFYPNNNFCVACCGSSVSSYQRDLLMSLGIEEVILAFDRDYEEEGDFKHTIFVNKILSIASKFNPYVNTYVIHNGMKELLGLKDSPSDKGKETLEELMRKKTYIGMRIQ